MAGAFDYFSGKEDVVFKARRLETLIRDCVPGGDKRLSKEYVERLLDEINTHGLLSESYENDKIDAKTRERCRRVVDAWVEKLIALVSSNETKSCWFGILFLGITFGTCSSRRFEASYAIWFQKLLPHVQVRAASDAVKAALCSSLSDLFTRLASEKFSDAKRDGVSFAGKLVQPLIQLLKESNSEDALENAIHLICTLLNYFPTSVYRHSDIIEAHIVSNLLSEKNSSKLRILAHCLAELPKAKGDEISWCSMMQKLLISINLNLNHIFQGLEEGSTCDKAIRGLVPPGIEPPSLFGGHKVSSESAESTSIYLLLCCTEMFTSYPVHVTVPVQPILALLERVLMVDVSVAKSSFPFITVMQQESICSRLPILHDRCLDLLTTLVRHVGGRLLPYNPKIVRLLIEYLNRCAMPKLRRKSYSILQAMLKLLGDGLAVQINKDVIKNAMADLNPVVKLMEGRSSHATKLVSNESLLAPCVRKRKNSAATESPNQQCSIDGFEANTSTAVSLSLMVAALEVLEALLSAGGLRMDEKLQSQVDLFLITVANAACKEVLAKKVVNTDLSNTDASAWEEFQIASFKALNTSFLASTRVRPPYLAQGIELFVRGKLEARTKIAEVCAEALPSLEVLIHPRARTLGNFRAGGDNYASNTSYKLENAMGTGLDELDPDEDNLYRSWLENENEADIPTADSTKKEDDIKIPTQNLDSQHENVASQSNAITPSVDDPQTAMAVEVGTNMSTENTDEAMTERTRLHESESLEGPTSSGGSLVGTVVTANQLQNAQNDDALASNQAPEMHAVDGFCLSHATDPSAAAATSQRFEMFKLDNSEDLDSFPDIIDAEPDSDSD